METDSYLVYHFLSYALIYIYWMPEHYLEPLYMNNHHQMGNVLHLSPVNNQI